mgnify:FL=1
MGWGILVSQRDYDDDDCYVAFYCNTGDEAFGPLETARGSPIFIKRQFYEHWPEACRAVLGSEVDPRGQSPDMLHRLVYLTFLIGGIGSYHTKEEYNEIWAGEEE